MVVVLVVAMLVDQNLEQMMNDESFVVDFAAHVVGVGVGVYDD